jgi:hypothetical protein
MKPHEILFENVNPQLLQYVSSVNGISRPQENLAVFIWTNKSLNTLLKQGLNSGEALRYVTTPEKDQAGLGIINLATNQAAVGAIDRDGGVFVVSSLDNENTDASAFMQTIRNSKVRKIFSRLEDLENLFDERERESKKTNGVSGDLKQDLLDANNELDDPVDEEYLDIETDDPKAVKRELEQKIKDLKKDSKHNENVTDKLLKLMHTFDSKNLTDENKKSISEYRRLRDKSFSLKQNIDSLEQLVQDNPDLFKLRTTDHKDDTEDEQVQSQINQWLESLLDDFPGLEVSDAEIFNPNPETIG